VADQAHLRKATALQLHRVHSRENRLKASGKRIDFMRIRSIDDLAVGVKCAGRSPLASSIHSHVLKTRHPYNHRPVWNKLQGLFNAVEMGS